MSGHIVPHIVHVVFSYLTTLTLLFFAFHVLIDFISELRMRLSSKAHHAPTADDVKTVVSASTSTSAPSTGSCWSGVILLGITGWPLRGAGSGGGGGRVKAFCKLFGGAEGAALWHRVGAVLIIISSLYHLFYLTFLACPEAAAHLHAPDAEGRLDMQDNILFMLGLRRSARAYDQATCYLEKFDYWAVFWGIIMMVGTGFVLWFPVFFAKYAPHWLISSTQIIHGEEATLAMLFLFVVHFYNVHLKPSIFPMNWVWLNGRITVEALKHEHPAEYERIKKDIK